MTRRRRTAGSRKSRLIAVTVAVLLAVVGLAAIAFGVLGSSASEEQAVAVEEPVRQGGPGKYDRVAAVSVDASASVDTSASIEIPDVVGLPLSEAQVVLEAAGFGVKVRNEVDGDESKSSVTTQTPSPGTVSSADTVVALSVAKGASELSAALANSGSSIDGDGLVVAIDPGHQQHSDTKPEPIGPGSRKTKAGVTGGTTGVATKLPEYEVALQISMNLKERLEAAGVRVVMTRTTNDVWLTNSQRAKVANEAGADIFVRIHCDGSPESKMAGISTLYPGKNKWTKPYVAESNSAASAIQAKVVESTGAVDRGINPRTDLTGFNYSKMPSVLVECGFMSNAVEDRLLASPHYQDKLASGIAEGVLAYLTTTAR